MKCLVGSRGRQIHRAPPVLTGVENLFLPISHGLSSNLTENVELIEYDTLILKIIKYDYFPREYDHEGEKLGKTFIGGRNTN